VNHAPLSLHGVIHLVRALRRRAGDLEELRVGIAEAPRSSIFYHAVQHRLRDPAGDDLAPDDFSAWTRGVVQHPETAERLGFAALQHPQDADGMRAAMVEVLEAIPKSQRHERDSPLGGEFEFLAGESVVMPWGPPVADAAALYEALAAADASVWFWHFIEEPWTTGATPTPIAWLRGLGEPRLAEMLAIETAKPAALDQVRRTTLSRWRRSRLSARVAAASGVPEPERREAGRRAIQGLVRRVRRPEGE